MSDDNKQADAAIRELVAEIRCFRQTLLVSFAMFCFISGLAGYPANVRPHPLFLAFAIIFLLGAGYSCLTKFMNAIRKLISEIREEARRSHSQHDRPSGAK